MKKDFETKISKKLVKSKAKMRQKFVESGAKIRLFESVRQCISLKNISRNYFRKIHFYALIG